MKTDMMKVRASSNNNGMRSGMHESSSESSTKPPPMKRSRSNTNPSNHDGETAALEAGEENDELENEVLDAEADENTGDDFDNLDYDSTEADPFPSCIRCTPVTDENDRNIRILWWHCADPFVPLAVEEAMIPTLMRWKDTERGMMKSQPPFRLAQIRKMCHKLSVPLLTALSLRRHHIKNLHPGQSMSQLYLGREQDIRRSAELFEQAIEEALRQHFKIAMYTESQQKKHYYDHRQPDEPFPPTPDFVLREPVRLRRFIYEPTRDQNHHPSNKNGESRSKHKPRRKILDEQVICWIEVKMFYGASTIEHDGKSAVGCLLNTARKYTRVHGKGAMVFLYGCGDRLAAELAQVGVLALDCGYWNRNHVSLQALQDHQRTWCADKEGNILI